MKKTLSFIIPRLGGFLGLLLFEIILWVIFWKFFGWWSIPIMLAGAAILGAIIAYSLKLYDFIKS